MGESGVDPRDYRRVMGRFATGVTVVTAPGPDGPRGMTVSSLTSVSLEPLLALFCVERIARFHDHLLASGVWAVSVLTAAQEPLSRLFAARGRAADAQHLEAVPHHPGPLTGAPLLSDALATLECRTVATHPGGDHTIVVGEVLAVDLPHPDAPPLLYYASGYHSL